MNVVTKTVQGKTLHFTRMGLGLAALGRPGYMTLGHADDLPAERTQEAMLLHAMGVLDAAWAAAPRRAEGASRRCRVRAGRCAGGASLLRLGGDLQFAAAGDRNGTA